MSEREIAPTCHSLCQTKDELEEWRKRTASTAYNSAILLRKVVLYRSSVCVAELVFRLWPVPIYPCPIMRERWASIEGGLVFGWHMRPFKVPR